MDDKTNHHHTSNGQFFDLPYEIIDLVVRYLDDVQDIRSLACVNRYLSRLITTNDAIWRRICQRQLGSLSISCDPYKSFRQLYKAIGGYLWLGNNAVWHGDNDCFGSLLVSVYRSGGIQLYELLCGRDDDAANERDNNEEENVFRPYLYKSLILPISGRHPQQQLTWTSPRGLSYELTRALNMPLNRRRPLMSLWPPANILADDRTRRYPINNGGLHQDTPADFLPSSTMPPTPAQWYQASSSLLRINRFVSRSSNSSNSSINSGNSSAENTPAHSRRKSLGNRVETYSKLSRSLYTPTEQCPWRGIWVGDYGLHGSEFLLLNQPSPDRLEAIKLTGDMNVPRGEYSFIVDDINSSLNPQVEYELWPGDVVQARGQIADVDFVNSRFLDTHLIKVSRDVLVHYWKHMSIFMSLYRVDVDVVCNDI